MPHGYYLGLVLIALAACRRLYLAEGGVQLASLGRTCVLTASPQIREKICEESRSADPVETTSIVEKQVEKVVEVRKTVERERPIYVKTVEVLAEEALYNAKLERLRQRLKANM